MNHFLIASNYLDWIALFLLIGFAALGYYIKRKVENLAQKQDLAKLTEIAGSINSKFDKANLVHRVQFEAEFQAYQALWSTAHDAVVAYIRWQSLSFSVSEGTITAFGEAQLAFANAVKRYEPFVPDNVLHEFKVLDELFVDAKIDHHSGIQKLPPDKSKARDMINDAAQKCVAAIKKRLSETLVVECKNGVSPHY